MPPNENIFNPSDKQPEDVLKPKFVTQYKELHQDIWHRLILVHTNITILQKIHAFPFHHFYAPQENVFWTMVYWNFLYTSVAFLHALVADAGKQKHTLPHFKNTILTHWLQDSHKPAYQALLRTGKFDKEILRITQKVRHMRHRIVAHRILDESPLAGLLSAEGLTVSDLRLLYDAAENLFFACSFGSEYKTTFIPYFALQHGKPTRKDIDNLLDLIAKNSPWLTRPERNGQFWPAIRQHIAPEDLQQLNDWRKKFGLPPA